MLEFAIINYFVGKKLQLSIKNTFNPTIYSLSLLTRVRAPHKPSSREIVVQVID
jgi:hypothetical protein